MKESFICRKFGKSTLAVIDQANWIVAEYQAQGFTLTLRQLFYQFVARALIPNTAREYKNLGAVVNNARLAGVLDWDAIEDRTRNLRELSVWETPADIIGSAAASYREDLWLDQKFRPQVWIEKDALLGVIEPACNLFRVPHYPHRGNNSQSEAYKSGKLFQQQIQDGKIPVVLHLGDHDPTGIDMTRDNADRLARFAGCPIEVRRIALNLDQVAQYRPPPNRIKVSDSRSAGYTAKFGNESWELDALEPTVIDGLITAEIQTMIDASLWQAAEERERAHRLELERAADRWHEIENFLFEP
jgi:hypothetical protein